MPGISGIRGFAWIPPCPPLIQITTEDGTFYLLGTRDGTSTQLVFEQLSQLVSLNG